MPWPTTYPFFHVDQPEQVDNAALLRRLQRPEGPVDVVLDTDTYNEIDDQYALAYLIKNDEKLKLKAIYAAPFCNNKAATPAIGMQKSYDEIKNILSLMGRTDLLDCTYRGSESYLPDEKNARGIGRGAASGSACHAVYARKAAVCHRYRGHHQRGLRVADEARNPRSYCAGVAGWQRAALA